MKAILYVLCSAVLLLTALSALAEDFDLTKHSIPVDRIRGGGPPKDGIPSLTDPKFVPAAKASFMKDSDRVIGIYMEGEARAYPYKILAWHEAVNDLVSQKPVTVTY